MGSSYFYLEFLMAFVSRLKHHGYRNPAVFALEYTLVPDAKHPTQLNQTRAGYQFLLNVFPNSAGKMVVAGDSAGATLILSMLLQTSSDNPTTSFNPQHPNTPALALLLSPWTHLISPLNQNTPSDYLSSPSLHLYATQYAGLASSDDTVSPGLSITRWHRASPRSGYRIIYGAEEVFAPGIEETVENMRKDGASVKVVKREKGIHAWPVVDLFLGRDERERLVGLDVMVEFCLRSDLGPKS